MQRLFTVAASITLLVLLVACGQISTELLDAPSVVTPTPVELIDSLIGDVESLFLLPRGKAEALTRQLKNAKAAFVSNLFITAASQMRVFVIQVFVFETQGALSESEAADLITKGNIIFDMIESLP